MYVGMYSERMNGSKFSGGGGKQQCYQGSLHQMVIIGSGMIGAGC